jgi:flagellar basal-body rod protein FlgG
MLSGFYTIASGVLAQQRNIDLIGNNLVNAETPGFRTSRMVFSTFEHELMVRIEANRQTFIGSASPITLVDDVLSLHHSGIYEETGNPFDFAIDGPGYFVIQGNDGQSFLTRGGQFRMDTEGYLFLPGRGRVMGAGGPLQVNNAEFTVSQDGTVLNQAGRRVGALSVVSPPADEVLVRLPNGMYQVQDGTEVEPAAGARLIQGAIERSNVDYNREMTNLIEAQRAFQTKSRALTMVDGMNRRAITTIAAV